MEHDNHLVNRLKNSPNRKVGEPRMQEAYESIKGRFVKRKRKDDNAEIRDSEVRQQWYPGNLREIAQHLGKSDEYDILLAAFHGCVHTSAHAMRLGPPLKAANLMMWATTVAARVVQLNLNYHRVALNELNLKIMGSLNRPYFEDR